MEFSIDIFLSGDFELLSYCACAYKEYEDSLPTELTVGPTEAPMDVDCEKVFCTGCPENNRQTVQIKSPEGMFIFLECITIEAGLYESSWFIEVQTRIWPTHLKKLCFSGRSNSNKSGSASISSAGAGTTSSLVRI